MCNTNLPFLNDEHPIDPAVPAEIEATLARIEKEFDVKCRRLWKNCERKLHTSE